MGFKLGDVLGKQDDQKQTEQRPEYTETQKKDFADKQKEMREAVKAEIAEGTKQIFSDGNSLRDFLKFSSKNTLERSDGLIRLYGVLKDDQPKTPVTEVKTFQGWADEGRRLKSGAKGYPFIASAKSRDENGMEQSFPDYDAKCFDITQTKGMIRPEPKKDVSELLTYLVLSNQDKITTSDRLPEGVIAQYVPSTQKVYLQEDQGLEQTFYELTRELAHAKYDEWDKNYQRSDYEVTAYCAAFMAAERYDVDTAPFPMESIAKAMAGQEPYSLQLMLKDANRGASSVIGQIRSRERILQSSQDISSFSFKANPPKAETQPKSGKTTKSKAAVR